MRVSDTEAAQRVADNDNLVGELVEAVSAAMKYYLNPFTIAMAAGCGYIVCIAAYIYAWVHVM
jgi:hypothetical protein